jgi:rfaE bifunctional protein kinase chain/domain
LKNNLKKLIENITQIKVLVLGDFILDEFIFGEISRVSREAPVLILNYQSTETVAGGGANTVANVAGLGAQVIPLGFLGNDPAADLLFSVWPEGLEQRYVFRDDAFQTTRKARILAGSFHSFRQQVVRMDYEQPYSLQENHERKLLEALTQLVPQVDGVILSDYSLGNINEGVRETALALASQHKKIIVADSRDNPDIYKGATSITPNITEVEAALSLHIGQDLSLLQEVGSRLVKEWQLEALLVTRGKLGMSLFDQDGFTHIPIYGNDEVVDVTGAGDTVTASYCTALAAGGSFEEAARLANYAAGLAVMKKGTATVSPAELLRAIEGDP